jgi:hypothetical protein
MSAARVKEVCHRLDDAGYRHVADLIRDRPPTGALLTREQMVALRDVLDKWIDEANAEGLGDVVGLRDVLETALKRRDEDAER